MDPLLHSHEKQQPVVVNGSNIHQNNARNPSLASTGTSNSTISQSPSPSEDEKPVTRKKRTRIAKACQYCRKKKVKCDGCQPCSNCQQSNFGNCEYAVDENKKPKISKKKSKSLKNRSSKFQISKSIDERLSKIENTLAQLLNHIDTNNNTPTPTPTSNSTTANDKQTETDKYSFSPLPMAIEKEVTDESNQKYDPKVESNFLGSHSVINIFSKKSVEWLLRPVIDKFKDDIEDFKKIAWVYEYYTQAFLDTISQPIKARISRRNDLMDNTFVDVTIPLEILSCYDDIFLVSYVCKGDYIRNLFQTYFEEPDQDGSRRRNFLWSELLAMTAAIGICISVLIDDRNNTKETEKPKYSCSLSNQQLIEINFKCFYSMIFYHRRLCVISEGFPTITGFILLIMYFDFAVPVSQITFLAVSTTIHYAKQCGLHRQETYKDMSWEEQRTRRVLWWFCEYLHTEYCFQKGYSLEIGDEDMISFSDDDTTTNAIVKSNWHLISSALNSENPIDALTINEIRENKANHICASYIMHSLSKIRAESYQLLYSTSAQKKTLSSILTSVEKLTADMESLYKESCSVMPVQSVSGYAKNTEIVLKLDNGYENVLMIQFEYFLHLMTINRLSLQDFPNDVDHRDLTDKCLYHRNIANRSARTILHIAKDSTEKKVQFIIINWFSYAIFAAFAHLGSMCLEDPQNPVVLEDIDLLIGISYSVFSFEDKSFKVSRFALKRYVYDMLTRYILKLYFKVTNEQTRNMFYTKYKDLDDHLHLEKTFHEFFVNGNPGVDSTKTYRTLSKLFRPFWLKPHERSKRAQVNPDDTGTPLGSSSSSSNGIYWTSTSILSQPSIRNDTSSTFSSQPVNYTQESPRTDAKPLEISNLVDPFNAVIDSATKSNGKELPNSFIQQDLSAINAAPMQQPQPQPPFPQPPFSQLPPFPPPPPPPPQQQEQQNLPRHQFNTNFNSLEEMIEENYVGDLNFPAMFYE
ncbi:zinc finger-containing tanscription factor, putative [Candida dubliniensis CD36]|uniref:Zinc finger-containing tanscription factor, putative n=1 Tax=Candida dubliniensis (strain CD36 / ATCC MYA-646 / CBS 7987 / NCPF 3949 / NRRL Y-17841) TaxID=573826 RepID=B9WHB1_CANDC|nr:zinc finger-containing tanscription factor, putative [Candida dubliniensis CD36]CAX41553.1 zinc finger-containing tanscription factor, putative [Candida dubliniensis CD36]